jgi:hypothetical protein
MNYRIKYFFFIILLFLTTNCLIYAQTDFQVEFYKSKGVLGKADLYKKDFGRYKGFEIPANKGEAGSFVVYSPNFRPSLFLTDPKGNIVKQAPSRDQNTVLLSVLFPEGGNYILFLVADSTSTGEYEFQYSFASEKSLTLSPDADFKTAIAYLTEHAKSYFLFFENPVEGKNSFYKLNGAADVSVERDGSYSAVFYKGDEINAANMVFDRNWKKETSEWVKNKNISEKFLQYKEKTGDEARIIKLSLFDFSKAKDSYRFSYGVSLTISKEH